MAGEFLYALCKSWLSSRIHTFSYDAKGDITIVHKVSSLLGDVSWKKTEDLYLIFEKSSCKSQVQQKSISKLIFAGYTGSRNTVRNRLRPYFSTHSNHINDPSRRIFSYTL